MTHKNSDATPTAHDSFAPPLPRSYNPRGGEKGPVILPAFKAGDPLLRGSDGGFDSHTLPPNT